MSDRVMTLHPEGKAGVNIDMTKYVTMKTVIIDCVAHAGEISFSGLINCVDEALSGTFEGSIAWYVTTVKLDLEARGLIERVPSRKPQYLCLAM